MSGFKYVRVLNFLGLLISQGSEFLGLHNIYIFSWIFRVLNFKNLYDLVLWIGFSCLKGAETLQRDSLHFTIQFAGVPGIHLINVEKLSWPWSHPAVLKPGHLDWKSCTLSTRSLLCKWVHRYGSGCNYRRVLNILGFWICMVSAYTSVAQGSEDTRIWLNNTSINFFDFGRRGWWICLNRPEYVLIIPQYVWICCENAEYAWICLYISE